MGRPVRRRLLHFFCEGAGGAGRRGKGGGRRSRRRRRRARRPLLHNKKKGWGDAPPLAPPVPRTRLCIVGRDAGGGSVPPPTHEPLVFGGVRQTGPCQWLVVGSCPSRGRRRGLDSARAADGWDRRHPASGPDKDGQTERGAAGITRGRGAPSGAKPVPPPPPPPSGLVPGGQRTSGRRGPRHRGGPIVMSTTTGAPPWLKTKQECIAARRFGPCPRAGSRRPRGMGSLPPRSVSYRRTHLGRR